MEYAPEEAEESLLLVYLAVFASVFYFLWRHRDKARYQNIPPVGFSGTITSYVTAIWWLYDQAGLVQKGYAKFPNGIFRYPTLTRWIVVVARPKYIEELRKAPEDEVSAAKAMDEILEIPHTIQSRLLADRELKSLLGTQLTRNLQECVPDIHPLVAQLVTALVPSGEDDWKYLDEADATARICNQVLNRVFVGASLSQDPQFVNQVAVVTSGLEQYARNTKRYPKLLRPFYVFFFTPLSRIKTKLRNLLANTSQKRQRALAESENELPNDMITWFLRNDKRNQLSTNELLAHILLVNYLAAYPMAKLMSQALRNLAKHPNWIKPLRNEIEVAIRSAGWTESAIGKMRKVDNFLKETMRLDSSALNPSFPKLTMARKCLRSITFSDGTTIPPNTLLFVGSHLLHNDVCYYSKPEVFDPMRFSSPLINGDFPSSRISPSSSDSSYHQPPEDSAPGSQDIPVSSSLPATSATFLAWGHGKHACPGRFFASTVMKLMLAQFVLEFDFRLPPIHENIGNERENILWIELRRYRRRLNSET